MIEIKNLTKKYGARLCWIDFHTSSAAMASPVCWGPPDQAKAPCSTSLPDLTGNIAEILSLPGKT